MLTMVRAAPECRVSKFRWRLEITGCHVTLGRAIRLNSAFPNAAYLPVWVMTVGSHESQVWAWTRRFVCQQHLEISSSSKSAGRSPPTCLYNNLTAYLPLLSTMGKKKRAKPPSASPAAHQGGPSTSTAPSESSPAAVDPDVFASVLSVRPLLDSLTEGRLSPTGHHANPDHHQRLRRGGHAARERAHDPGTAGAARGAGRGRRCGRR